MTAIRAAQQDHMSSNQILTLQQDIACEVLSKKPFYSHFLCSKAVGSLQWSDHTDHWVVVMSHDSVIQISSLLLHSKIEYKKDA